MLILNAPKLVRQVEYWALLHMPGVKSRAGHHRLPARFFFAICRGLPPRPAHHETATAFPVARSPHSVQRDSRAGAGVRGKRPRLAFGSQVGTTGVLINPASTEGPSILRIHQSLRITRNGGGFGR